MNDFFGEDRTVVCAKGAKPDGEMYKVYYPPVQLTGSYDPWLNANVRCMDVVTRCHGSRMLTQIPRCHVLILFAKIPWKVSLLKP